MNDRDTKSLEAGLRCVQWFTDYSSLITPASIFETKSNAFTALVAEIQSIAGDHEASASEGIGATAVKGSERQDLINAMDPVRTAARAAEFFHPGMRDRYRYTVVMKDEDLLARGRAFVINGADDEALLITYEAPAAWVAAVGAACDAFQATFGPQSSAKGAAVATNAQISTKIDEMMVLKAFLTHLIKNVTATDPGAAAAWHTASHVELPPTHKKTTP